MIARKLIEIQLKEGVTARLLLTPALYGIARERGIDLFPPAVASQDKTSRVVDLYAKVAFCAAISAWEVEAVDHPDKGDFPFSFEDFTIWAWSNPKEFGHAMDCILRALTGKSAREYALEAADEKKKLRKTKNPFRWIMQRLKPSSSADAA